ncbi:MAG TPA: VCBS repeat-containing protein [Kofleriaceae bacterium]|jgi:hypothetical protein|nr:VCBS repeat-containing protein [Kofleriaceae bacterium]
MRVLIVLSALTACYQPSVTNCQYTCGPSDSCPDGQTCTNGFCVSLGEVCAGSGGSGGSGIPDVPIGLAPANGVYTGSYRFAGSLTPTFRWSAVSGTDYYELDLDPTCVTPQSCTFPDGSTIHASSITTTSYTPSMLAVSTTPPVGQRYGWRVRACNSTGCSAWTAARYLNVGRLRDDFDGDGASEIAIGAVMTANLAFFDVDGSGSPTLWTNCAPSNGEVSFGFTLVVGDFNGDGYSDVAAAGIVGSVSDVTVIPGGASLNCPSDERLLHLGSDATAFANQIAGVGDLDGDGFDDLVALEITPTGRELDVYFGGQNGLDAMNPVAIQLMSAVPIGALVAGMGDIDGDGYLDVAFATGSGAGPTGIAIVPGSSSRVFSATTILTEPGTASFGDVIAIADVDGDGLAELFATAQTDDADPTNFVIAFRMSPTGLMDVKHLASSDMDASFGDALLPIRAGSATELAVGDTGRGVTIIDGNLDATVSNIDDTNTNPEDDAFGAPLGGGDIGTGSTWLAVGAVHDGGDKQGGVFFCPRTGSDPSTGFATCVQLLDPNGTHNDSFGTGLTP